VIGSADLLDADLVRAAEQTRRVGIRHKLHVYQNDTHGLEEHRLGEIADKQSLLFFDRVLRRGKRQR
jgi:hypothetical protein